MDGRTFFFHPQTDLSDVAQEWITPWATDKVYTDRRPECREVVNRPSEETI
jgi:hypothetical protein